jgi:hypothetical protein
LGQLPPASIETALDKGRRKKKASLQAMHAKWPEKKALYQLIARSKNNKLAVITQNQSQFFPLQHSMES